MLECSACLCSPILSPLCQSSPMSRQRKRLAVFPLRKPAARILVRTLCFCILPSHQCHFTEIEQEITTPLVLSTQQVQGRSIMGDGLFSRCRLQCLCCSTERVIDASRLVATVYKMEGQRSELVHIHGLLLPILGLKEATNQPVQASTPRGADLRIEALTNFVVGKREGSCLLGSDEPSTYSLKQTRLNCFHLLLLHRGKQRETKGASNEGRHPQVINTLCREVFK